MVVKITKALVHRRETVATMKIESKIIFDDDEVNIINDEQFNRINTNMEKTKS